MREIIKKWLEFAEKDLKVANELFKRQYWDYCVLMCHQAIEKILKAHIIERSSIPKKTHDLVSLYRESKLELPENWRIFIKNLSSHYMPPRYPDIAYKTKIIYNQEIATNFLKETKEIFKWLKNKLDQKK